MHTDTATMLQALNAFNPEPGGEASADLYDITQGFKALPDRELLVPAMFALMERADDVDLGAPGPLVRCIESLGLPLYENQLIESVRRKPVELNVWMVNRILNVEVDPARRSRLMELLRSVIHNPVATPEIIESATEFLDLQADRDAG